MVFGLRPLVLCILYPVSCILSLMSLTSTIAFNTLSQIAGKFTSTFLGITITILLTRYLGPAGFGTYTFAVVFVTLFGTIADWGLTLITVRQASKSPAQKTGRIIGNIVVVRFLLSLLATIIAIFLITVLPYDPQTRLVTTISAFYLLALSLKTSFQIVFNVKLQMDRWALSEVCANFLTLLILLFLLSSRPSLPEIMLAFLAGSFFSALVAARLAQGLITIDYSLITSQTKYLLFEALPMGAILVMFTVYNRVDTVILAHFQGASAVGLYGAAYRIFEVLVLGAAYFANSVLPLISRLAANDREKLKVVYRQSFVVLFFLGLGVALVNYLLSPFTIDLIAGPQFTGSILPLQILSLALVASYFNHLNGYTLIALGKQWYSFAIAALALVVNVALNLIFIPVYSYPAAAWITFLTEVLIVVASLFVIKKELKTFPALSDIPAVIQKAIVKRGHIF